MGDHWFEIPFDEVETLRWQELGKMFTTRMPRGLSGTPTINPDDCTNKDKFKENLCEKLKRGGFAVILVEKKEMEKVGSAELLSVYSQCGISTHPIPITDYQTPTSATYNNIMQQVINILRRGDPTRDEGEVNPKNVLVHCLGGSGRTGMIVVGVLRELGHRDPISFARQIKSVYLDTFDQELFIKSQSLSVLSMLLSEFDSNFVAARLADSFGGLCEDPQAARKAIEEDDISTGKLSKEAQKRLRGQSDSLFELLNAEAAYHAEEKRGMYITDVHDVPPGESMRCADFRDLMKKYLNRADICECSKIARLIDEITKSNGANGKCRKAAGDIDEDVFYLLMRAIRKQPIKEPKQDEGGSWDGSLDEWLVEPGSCYAAGLANLADGWFYAAAPQANEAGWGYIYKEDYKEAILQPDGETAKDMDIWEGDGLKSAIQTGKKPDWGLWLGGKKYNITRYEKDFEQGEYQFPMLFAQRPKGGVLIASSKSQIVVGFYDEEKGQTAGNCKKAVADFCVYLWETKL